mgnify:CR=1 FL=1
MTLRQLKRLHGEEQGLALIVSMMVAFVVLMLSTIVVAQSIHSLETSGYDRQRLTLGDASAADLRISGTFRVGDNAAFAEALKAMLPLDIEASDEALRLVIKHS